MIGSQFVWKTIQAIIQYGFFIALATLVARLLAGPAYATFAVVISMVVLLQPIAGMGIGRSASRYIAHARGSQNRPLTIDLTVSAVAWSGVVIALFTTLFLLSSPLIERLYGQSFVFGSSLLWAAGLVFLESFNDSLDHILRGHRQFHIPALAQILGRPLSLFLALLFLQESDSVNVALQTIAVGGLLILIVQSAGVLAVSRGESPGRRLLSRRVFHPRTRELLRYALPIALNLFFVALYARAHTIILALFQEPTEVGAYDLAYQYFSIPLGLTPVIGLVLGPVAAETAVAKLDMARTQIETMISHALSMIFFLYLPITCFFMLLGDDILAFIFPDFPMAGQLLVILSPLILIRGLGQVFSGDIGIALGHAQIIAKLTLAFGVVTSVAYFIVAPRWGAQGIAFVTLAVHSLAVIVSSSVLIRRLGIKPTLQVREGIVIVVMATTASLLMSVFATGMLSLLLQAAGFWLAFGGAILLWRLISGRFPKAVRDSFVLMGFRGFG